MRSTARARKAASSAVEPMMGTSATRRFAPNSVKTRYTE
jgi:hypothetical protein